MARISDEPVSMYFKQTPDGIFSFHSINRFTDKLFMGGISVLINRDIWKEVANKLQTESDNEVFLMNDEGELLSGSTPKIASLEVLDVLHTMDIPAKLVFHQSKQYFYLMERIGNGQLTIVKVFPLSTVKESAYPTIRAGLLTGGIALHSFLIKNNETDHKSCQGNGKSNGP